MHSNYLIFLSALHIGVSKAFAPAPVERARTYTRGRQLKSEDAPDF